MLAARDLEATVTRLRAELGLGEPYRDPAVAYFGLENAVFAIGDTFLEVISPVGNEPGAQTAARQLDRSGSAVCGYMAMIQVEDLAAARERARAAEAREVFGVELDDIAEVHLHPGDMRAIVALSEPRPPTAWRWGGEGWIERSVPGAVKGLTVGVADPAALASRWESVGGGPIPGCRFEQNEGSPGIVAIELEVRGKHHAIRPRELAM
ncbi:MAG TPA: VOC family protein [Solirubrobacterales bacterium]|nr:VOC family protein [Solirubrobacterales bacterium]